MKISKSIFIEAKLDGMLDSIEAILDEIDRVDETEDIGFTDDVSMLIQKYRKHLAKQTDSELK